MDFQLLEKLSRFSELIPTVYSSKQKNKSNKEIILIKFPTGKSIIAEKNPEIKINRFYILNCISTGILFDTYEEAIEYSQYCKQLKGYKDIFEIAFLPPYKQVTIHVCMMENSSDKYRVYIQLDNYQFSEEQWLSTAYNGRRFKDLDGAFLFANEFKNRLSEASDSIEVSLVHDTKAFYHIKG